MTRTNQFVSPAPRAELSPGLSSEALRGGGSGFNSSFPWVTRHSSPLNGQTTEGPRTNIHLTRGGKSQDSDLKRRVQLKYFSSTEKLPLANQPLSPIQL